MNIYKNLNNLNTLILLNFLTKIINTKIISITSALSITILKKYLYNNCTQIYCYEVSYIQNSFKEFIVILKYKSNDLS